MTVILYMAAEIRSRLIIYYKSEPAIFSIYGPEVYRKGQFSFLLP